MSDIEAQSGEARQVDHIYQQGQLGFHYPAELPAVPEDIQSGTDLSRLGRLIVPSVEIEGEIFDFRVAGEIRNTAFGKIAHGVIRGGYRFNALEPHEVEELIGPEATLLWHPWQALVRAQLMHERAQRVLDNPDLPERVKIRVDALSHSQATESYILSEDHDDGELVYGDTALRNKTPEHERLVFETSVDIANSLFGKRGGVFPILPYDFIERALRHDIETKTPVGQYFKANERWGYLDDGTASLRSANSRSILLNDSWVQSSLVEFGLESTSREVEHFSNTDFLLRHPMLFDVMRDRADELEARLRGLKEEEVAEAIRESVEAVAEQNLLPDRTTVESEVDRIKILATNAGRIIVQDPAYRVHPTWEEFALAVA